MLQDAKSRLEMDFRALHPLKQLLKNPTFPVLSSRRVSTAEQLRNMLLQSVQEARSMEDTLRSEEQSVNAIKNVLTLPLFVISNSASEEQP